MKESYSKGALGLVFICILTISVVGIGLGAATTEQYRISVSDSIDTPNRTVTFKGSNYAISSVAQADVGDTISVSVTAPKEETYSIIVYNRERLFALSSKTASGDATVRFDLSELSSGTYTIAVDTGDFEAVHPLVIRGYSVSLRAPAEVSSDESLQTSVDVGVLPNSKSLESVQVILGNSEQSVKVTARKTSDGLFEATLPTDGFERGNYRLYALVRGTQKAFGEKEILGVSEGHSVSIGKRQDGTESPHNSGNTPDDSTPTVTSTTTTSETGTTTRRTVETSEPTSTIGGEPDTPIETDTPTMTATLTDPSVITANPSLTSTNSRTTRTIGQPGFGLLTPLSAVVLLLLYTRRLTMN